MARNRFIIASALNVDKMPQSTGSSRQLWMRLRMKVMATSCMLVVKWVLEPSRPVVANGVVKDNSRALLPFISRTNDTLHFIIWDIIVQSLYELLPTVSDTTG